MFSLSPEKKYKQKHHKLRAEKYVAIEHKNELFIESILDKNSQSLLFFCSTAIQLLLLLLLQFEKKMFIAPHFITNEIWQR
jgi:hypothetical protein